MTYEKARAWIKKNLKPGEYRTYEDLIKDVMKTPGFNNVKKWKKFEKGINMNKLYRFQSQKELSDYIASEKQKIEEQLKALQRLEQAKSQDEIEKIFMGKVKEKPVEVPKAPKRGILGRIAGGIKGFFKGIFKRR